MLMPLLFLTAVSELPLLNVAVWLLSLSLVIHSDVILCSSEAIVYYHTPTADHEPEFGDPLSQ